MSHQKVIHVDRRDHAVFQAAADQEKEPLNLLLGKYGCHVGVVFSQAIVKGHQAEVPARRIFSGKKRDC